ncbi:gamma-butyrobetaine hydroxylase-like domain-containing protein [Aureimonas leprariae]|uniref:DUF971 domain-containing protein n=1 Tax=Plantimonas leprariae TaxID=2615207 RepID=A0A7V7PS67_9HYPH|nr:DUF971 domain-containing protein [Aureimonas leprariae]KAB0681885.1 DUF971 domain-containing protein [Aureimonas leprariae]
MSAEAAPRELRVSKDRRQLTVRYADDATDVFPAELLRVVSPSAEVQGHSPEQRVTVSGKRQVAIADLVPTGHYAVRIVFDDGHDTGIFTWVFLAELGRRQGERWEGYLADLAAKGLSRDR